MNRTVLALGGGVVALGIAGAIFWGLRPVPESPSPAAVNAAGAEIGGPFELTTHEGERITSEELIDGPTLVYFGYTFCPDVCPVDTQVMVEAVAMLEEKGIEATPVFITVDPARDDPEALKYWAEAHHPRMVALTGTAEEIAAAAEEYKVYYEKVETPDSEAGYLMNHSAFTYLMTEDGLAAMFRNGYPPEEMASEVERVLTAEGRV